MTASIDVIVQPGALDHAEIVGADRDTQVVVGADHAFSARAFDRFDNTIDPTDVSITWDAGAIGTIDATGAFVAGTGAGTFDEGIFASVTQGTASAEAKAPITLLPGALANVSITPENPVVGAEEQLPADRSSG